MAASFIHRWDKGEDGSIVTGNRIARIGANDGGTGQNGNGINIFRAGDVLVSDNQIADCAFTAVRANSASNAGHLAINACAPAKQRSSANSNSKALWSATISSTALPTALRLPISTKGGRLASVTGNIIRNLSLDRPLSSGERLRHRDIGRSRHADCFEPHRKCPALGPETRLGALSP